jgi:hypothetical protein
VIGRFGPREAAVCIEAAIVLTVAELALKALPFRWLARTLGNTGEAQGVVWSPDQRAALQRVTWLGGAMARRHPLRPQCLAHSIAAKWMLGWRGIPCTLYIGLREDDASANSGKPLASRIFVAHAWVHADGEAIAGGRGNAHAHTLLGIFS